MFTAQMIEALSTQKAVLTDDLASYASRVLEGETLDTELVKQTLSTWERFEHAIVYLYDRKGRVRT